MKHAGALFLVLLSAWLLLSGHYTPLLLILGFFSCLFVLLMMRRLGVLDDESAPFGQAVRALIYLPWLLLQILKANIDVAKRVLQPKMPIKPHLFRVRVQQKSDLGRVLYANSITLTPGTVTVGMEGDELLIHALTEEAADGVRSGEMDRRVRKVEGSK
jgi:multicomponent Na+:H+ antiporter subunit E